MVNKQNSSIDPTVLRMKIRKDLTTLKPRVASLFINEVMNNKEAGFYLDDSIPAYRVSPILQKQMSDLGVNNQVTALMKDWLCYNISILPQFNLYIVYIKFSDGAIHNTTIDSFANDRIRELNGVNKDMYLLWCIKEIVFQCIKDRLKNIDKS